MDDLRCAIYGAGSLGTVLGAYITMNGVPIDLINRNKAHVSALNENGARIVGSVDLLVPVSAFMPEDMEGKYDIIFLLTKQLQNKEVVTMLKDYLAENGVIVTLQNGIPEPEIAAIVGSHRTMGCTVEWGATLSFPGVCTLTSSPDSLYFHMGKMEGISEEQYNRVKSILELMCPVHQEENLMGARWSKLLINATFSGIGTVIGGVFGDVCDNKASRSLAIRCMKECIDVGHAAGVNFAPVQDKNIVKLFYYKGPLKRKIASMIIPVAMKKHRHIEPSMLQDIRNSKPCEIDAINGVVCSWGKKNNVETPINDRIVSVIKKCESGELYPDISNLRFFDEFI